MNKKRVLVIKKQSLKFIKTHRLTLLLAVVVLVGIGAPTSLFLATKHASQTTGITLPQPSRPVPSISPSSQDQQPTPSLTSSQAKTYVTPTQSTTSINTPTVMQTQHNPPNINISYPSNGQSITFTSASQQFCVVDVPAGGSTVGLQRKVSINATGWNAYVPESTLCFEPQNGVNMLQLQYKNGAGDESNVYTVQFTFHRNQNISVNLSGQAYTDQNCNKSKDAGEQGVSGVNLSIIETSGRVDGQVSTDSNGNYNFSQTIAPDASISIYPDRADHTYSFTTPGAVTLNANSKSATVDIPILPSGGCH